MFFDTSFYFFYMQINLKLLNAYIQNLFIKLISYAQVYIA